MDEGRLAQLALHFVPGIGSFLVKQLVSYCGSAKAVFETPKNKLLKVPGVGLTAAEAILKQQPLEKARTEFEVANKDGTQILFHSDKNYPHRLKHINDAPSLLYLKGIAELNNPKIVSIVGTRKATDYGKSFVAELVESLIPHDVIIVSGLAYGIDIQAHKSSLKHDLPTIGVMAGGMNMIYPAAHRSIAQNMIEAGGGLLTEQHFDSKPDPHNFPARNRIIAGMADAVIVVEAAKKGGALITAHLANDYNKDVFAVPGELGKPYSEGCNNLIKTNKAHLLTGISDVEYIMNWEKGEPGPQVELDFSDLPYEEKRLITELRKHNDGLTIDKLSWTTEISVNGLASLLLNLEFKGLVKSLPGKRYKIHN